MTPVDPGALESWEPLVRIGVIMGVLIAGLAFAGRGDRELNPLLLVARGLERITRIPGWAASMVGLASVALLIAGEGFYNDVAWHVALGRDEELFTAPHTMITMGLGLLAAAGALGIIVATLENVDTRLRFVGLRVPASAATMLLVGTCAVAGFPLDELWHHEFGIDVTMWSPTHLLMIVGASVTPIVSWLALAEAGVRPSDSRWARGAYVVVGLMLIDGLSSVQGEFDFGVPQFQLLYLPVLVVLAAGIAITAIRIAHGPGWSFLVVGLMLVTRFGLGEGSGDVGLDYRPAALYIGSAVAIEAAGWIFGVERRTRFVLAAAFGVATLGLATEWLWSAGAHQPMTSALLPDAAVLGLVTAVGAVVVGAALGDLARLRRPVIDSRALVIGGLVLLVALAWPYPRRTGDVTAAITLDRAGDGTAFIEADLDPGSAADDARWFQASAWQGGGLELADMQEVEPGLWRSERPVPVSGEWKTLLRLHRGAEMMTVPIFLPADAEIEGPRGEAVPAVDKVAPFEKETRYLLREQQSGSVLFAWAIPGAVLLAAASWILAFVWAARRSIRGEPERSRIDEADAEPDQVISSIR